MVQLPLPGATPEQRSRFQVRPARSDVSASRLSSTTATRQPTRRSSTLLRVPEGVEELNLTDNLPEDGSPESGLRGTLEPPDLPKDIGNRMSQVVSTIEGGAGSPDQIQLRSPARSSSPAPAPRRSANLGLPPKKMSRESFSTIIIFFTADILNLKFTLKRFQHRTAIRLFFHRLMTKF